MAVAPPAKRRKFTNNVTVELVVGQGLEQTSFFAFKDHICHTSSFFASAFDGGFKESKGVLLLPEDDHATVEAFIEWVFTRQYKSMNEEAIFRDSDIADKENNALIDLYVFADKVDCQDLKRQIITWLFNFHNSDRARNGGYAYIPDLRQLQKISSALPARSGLLKLSVALNLWVSDMDCDKKENFSAFRNAAIECPELGAELLVEALAKWHGRKKNPLEKGRPEDFFEPCMLAK